jgi:small neutral amino acid transporter SnatA (MarC family)
VLNVEIVSEPTDVGTRAFYPLTLPLTVGPGTISVAITIGAHHPKNIRSALMEGTADVIGALIIAATVFVCYRYADRLLRRLGETGTSVLIRLSAFILLCVGVQIFWTGASALLAALPARRRVEAADDRWQVARVSAIIYDLPDGIVGSGIRKRAIPTPV